MLNSLCKLICVYGLIGLLWPGYAASQMPPQPSPVPNAPNQLEPPVRLKQYVPLGQVLPRATQETGVKFQAPDPVLKEEVPVKESGPGQSLDMEPVLDEFSRIELFGDNSKLQKVIILNRNTSSQSQAPTSAFSPTRKQVRPPTRGTSVPSQKPPTQPATPPLPTTNLSKEQLQKLIRGAYRSPLEENFWDDPDYREILTEQGITSREEMNDRNKAKNVRKTVRRLLWQMKNKS